MKEVEISADQVEPPSWSPNFSLLLSLTLVAIGRNDADVRVMFCSPAQIAELNDTYRNHTDPTDVLSFTDDEAADDAVAGDIALCAEEVSANASQFGVSAEEELSRVFVHGVLHLAGYSHGDAHIGDPEALSTPMFMIQEQIVAQYWKERAS